VKLQARLSGCGSVLLQLAADASKAFGVEIGDIYEFVAYL